MKKIKFPLEMKNGKMVREMEEFQEYFDLKKALGYFANGRLQKWLENNYENDILEELEELTGEEDDFLQRFLDILGIECREDNDLEVQKVFKESVIKEKLKRVLPEKEIEEKAEKTVDSQKGLENLIKRGEHLIYLLSEHFVITKEMEDLELVGIDFPEIKIEETEAENFYKQKIKISGEYNMNDEGKKLLHRDVINEVAWDFLEMMQAHVNSIVPK